MPTYPKRGTLESHTLAQGRKHAQKRPEKGGRGEGYIENLSLRYAPLYKKLDEQGPIWHRELYLIPYNYL